MNTSFSYYTESPLLVINTDRLDLENDAVIEDLFQRLGRTVIGTEFYNPDAMLWG